jgi:hypothetical protein
MRPMVMGCLDEQAVDEPGPGVLRGEYLAAIPCIVLEIRIEVAGLPKDSQK